MPVPVYGAVPPLPDTVTVAFAPLHKIAVAFDDAVNKVGSVIVTEVVAVQALASVNVKL